MRRASLSFSRVPCRPPLQALPPELLASCRITECFIRVRALDVKVITVYGVPRCLPDAADHNNRLLAWAYQRATISCVPAIIGGDFNTLPQDLPAWEAFAQQGWMELGEFSALVHNLDLPPFRPPVRGPPDLILSSCRPACFSLCIVPMFSRSRTCSTVMLPCVRSVHLRLPGAPTPRWVWPAPKDFTGLLTTTSDLERHYCRQSAARQSAFGPQVPEIHDGDKLRLWAVTVEEAVHQNIQDQYRRCRKSQPSASVLPRPLPAGGSQTSWTAAPLPRRPLWRS